MKKLFTSILVSFALVLFVDHDVKAQEALKQKPSPLGMVTYTFEDTYIKVTYGRPHLRGRAAFGEGSELAPVGKIWRTGANEATELTVSDAILVAGDTLNAGTYSVFTIPKSASWTVIINEEVGQWGAYNYLEKSDVLRVEVPTDRISGAIWEPFTIKFEPHNGTADLLMMWDRTQVKIPIEFLD